MPEYESPVRPGDLENHLRAKEFRRIMAVMDLAAVPPVVEIDDVSSRRGFELVEEIPARPRSRLQVDVGS